MSNPTLSTINPDFEDIANQLKLQLLGKNSWRGLLDSETGSILIESVAAVGTLLLASVQAASEENNSDTAKLDSSLKAIGRTLGVRLQRKTPAGATVTLNIPVQATTYTIPAYSQFTSSGKRLFNRVAIVFTPGQTTKTGVELHEGLVQQYVFSGDGTPFQTLWLNLPGFTVSDRDVLMTADNQPVVVAQDALWHYKNVTPGIPTDLTRIVQDRTLPTGELEILFGNSLYAYQPPNASVLALTYVVTNGALGNDAGFLDQDVRCDTLPLVTGVGTSALINGANEPDAEVYRNSPLIYASYGRAVSIPDHEALALQYENLVDARFLGQQLIAPTVREYMNVVYMYGLQSDGTQLDVAEFADFKAWLQPKAAPLDYVRKAAVAIPVTINASVSIRNTGDPATVQSNVIASVTKLFTPKGGFLGRNLYHSDIMDAIKDADQNIDWVNLIAPIGDIICHIDPPGTPTIVASNAGGTLVPGTTYTYAVSALNSQGETFASQIIQIVLPASQNRVTVSWLPVPGATGYRIYGRIDTNMKKIGSDLAASVTSYMDNGSGSLTTSINLINTSGLYYVTLAATPTIDINFTNRRG